MPRTIRFDETIHTFQIDFNRHVSNIVYVQWMEIGRLKLLREAGLAAEKIDREGFAPVLVETLIRYRKPLVMGDPVVVECWLSDLSEIVAWMDFRFYRGETLVAEGRQKGVFVHTATGRPKRLTEDERQAFLPFLHASVPD